MIENMRLAGPPLKTYDQPVRETDYSDVVTFQYFDDECGKLHGMRNLISGIIGNGGDNLKLGDYFRICIFIDPKKIKVLDDISLRSFLRQYVSPRLSFKISRPKYHDNSDVNQIWITVWLTSILSDWTNCVGEYAITTDLEVAPSCLNYDHVYYLSSFEELESEIANNVISSNAKKEDDWMADLNTNDEYFYREFDVKNDDINEIVEDEYEGPDDEDLSSVSVICNGLSIKTQHENGDFSTLKIDSLEYNGGIDGFDAVIRAISR